MVRLAIFSTTSPTCSSLNGLHYVLDVSYSDDDSRVRKGNAAENLSTVRRIAINLLKQDLEAKYSWDCVRSPMAAHLSDIKPAFSICPRSV